MRTLKNDLITERHQGTKSHNWNLRRRYRSIK